MQKLLAIGSAAVVLAAVGTASAQTTVVTSTQTSVGVMAPMALPMITFEAGGGVVSYTDGETNAGPAWTARIRANLTPEVGLETGYLGSIHDRNETDDTDWMMTTQVDGGLRFSPFTRIGLPANPYATAGVGYAGFSGNNGDMTALVVPFSVGADSQLTQNISAGVRMSVRPVFLEDLSTAADRVAGREGPGGDHWTATAYMGGSF